MVARKILIVDDDVPLTKTLVDLLGEAGYQTIVAYTAEDGFTQAISAEPDLALLDIMVPSMGGLELCRHIRERMEIPIIFLTALGEAESVVQGLEMGADDYLVKPYQKAVLVARIHAHLRRINRTKTANTLRFGDGELLIDLPSRMVHLKGESIDLTPREYALLITLAKNAGRVITTQNLIEDAWGPDFRDATYNIKPYIHYLRRKIEADPASPRWIVTARGVGYRFVDE